MQGYNRGKKSHSRQMENYIKFVSESKIPVKFIHYAETVAKGTSEWDIYEEDVPQVITNLEGRPEWVGEYKYN